MLNTVDPLFRFSLVLARGLRAPRRQCAWIVTGRCARSIDQRTFKDAPVRSCRRAPTPRPAVGPKPHER